MRYDRNPVLLANTSWQGWAANATSYRPRASRLFSHAAFRTVARPRLPFTSALLPHHGTPSPRRLRPQNLIHGCSDMHVIANERLNRSEPDSWPAKRGRTRQIVSGLPGSRYRVQGPATPRPERPIPTCPGPPPGLTSWAKSYFAANCSGDPLNGAPRSAVAAGSRPEVARAGCTTKGKGGA